MFFMGFRDGVCCVATSAFWKSVIDVFDSIGQSRLRRQGTCFFAAYFEGYMRSLVGLMCKMQSFP